MYLYVRWHVLNSGQHPGIRIIPIDKSSLEWRCLWCGIDTCPQFTANQVKIDRFKVVEDINGLSMEGGILEEFLRNTATTECQLARAHFIEGDHCWLSKTLKEFTDEVHWKVVAAQRCGNSVKAKTSKQHIFTRELPNVKSLEVFLESIPGFLIFDD